jgi:predicted TIM-barrel enzyme
VISLCHGGPVSMHDDAQSVNRFYGASRVERLQSEIAIREQMEKFKAIQF